MLPSHLLPGLSCVVALPITRHSAPYCPVGLQVPLMVARPCPAHQIECCGWLKCWALTTSQGHSGSSQPLCDSYEEVKEEIITLGKTVPQRFSLQPKDVEFGWPLVQALRPFWIRKLVESLLLRNSISPGKLL